MPAAISPVGKTEILEGFPPAPPAMTGEPTLRELIRVLMHLIQCSLSLFTDISPFNYLFLVLKEDLYKSQTDADPPAIPTNPGHRANYTGVTNSAIARAATKDEYEYNKTRHENCRHMNEALTERFLSLLIHRIRQAFLKAQFIKNPNSTFLEVFDWFIERYAVSDEMDRADNKERMLADWHPNDGFEALVDQIQDGVLFAKYANKPIKDDEVVDMAIQVAMKSGLFTECYKMWHRINDQDQKTWAKWQDFWRGEYQLNFSMNKTASKFGFGMNAAANASEQQEGQFQTSVNDFATAHSATQSTISGLTQTSQGLAATNQQLAAQNQQLQMMLAAQQQQQTQLTTAPFQWNQQQQQNNNRRGGRRRNQRNNNNRRNNSGWNPAGWTPNQQNQGQQQQALWKQRPWPILRATGQPIDPLNIKTWNNENYCWTHGHDLSNGHTSATCTFPHASGLHQRGATKRNTMGGNPKGEGMHKPSECGLNEGTWRKDRSQQASGNWNLSPVANQAVQQPVPQQVMAPALTMMAPQWPMQWPMQQPVMQQPMQQQQGANSMMGVPGYCMMAPSANGGTMRMM